MSKITRSVAASIFIAAMSGNAPADPGRPARPSPHHYHGGGGGLNWLGAILLIGFTAAVVDAVTSQPKPPPPPKYVPPPVQPAPVYIEQPAASGMWYYCKSSGQYYPYVRTCPEGWEELPPVPAN